MTDVTVGHQVVDTLVFLDQNGNPMQAPVTPDSPPVWANVADASVDTFTVSADGSTATVVAKSAGVDSVSVSVIVNGKTFTASQQLTLHDAPQVVSAVAIQADIQ